MSGMLGNFAAMQPAQCIGGSMIRTEITAGSPREMRLLAKFLEDMAKAREDDISEALAQQRAYAERLAATAPGYNAAVGLQS